MAKELFPFAFKSEPETPKTEAAKAPDTAPVSSRLASPIWPAPSRLPGTFGCVA